MVSKDLMLDVERRHLQTCGKCLQRVDRKYNMLWVVSMVVVMVVVVMVVAVVAVVVAEVVEVVEVVVVVVMVVAVGDARAESVCAESVRAVRVGVLVVGMP